MISGPAVTPVSFPVGVEQQKPSDFGVSDRERSFLSPLLGSPGDHSYVTSQQPTPFSQPYFDQLEGSEDTDYYLHPPAMATNGRPPSRPPPPNMRPPAPNLRPNSLGTVTPGPPPSGAPPPVPASPAGARKFSLQTPPPNSNSVFMRHPEKIGENKVIKFGETKLRSPSPGRNSMVRNTGPERKVR